MSFSRRKALTALATGAAAAPGMLARPAIAREVVEWRMVTSWPKNLPGPGITAQKLADLIGALSGGRLQVKLYAAGELVPAQGVFSAVSNATAQMGHSAPLFWAGKFSAAPLFTAAPFGLTPIEHITWIVRGGGQELWDELYRPAGVKPFMASNTGYQMGGWFREPVETLDDLKGLRIRMPGLGGLVMARLGAQPVSLPPGEIFQALQTGLIDATEFLGPFSDRSMGFHRIAKNYYFPGFHEPNGTGEALVNIEALQALPDDLQAIVATACEWVNNWSLADSEWENARALSALEAEDGVVLREYPAAIIDAARAATSEVLAELAAADDLSRRIVESYTGAARHQQRWSSVSVRSFLSARKGDA